ncbi:MAG: helix-turn-helix transcriptional regulator, partial [Lachnospiraceae bacterium]|nr:helix-turn-helix transcriptional regulator [Lachnospiraceae bacterium]
MSAKGDATKTAIIRAAGELFAMKGFKDVTMTDICDSTGLSRGGLYRHFSSTEEIFNEVLLDEFS